MQISQLIDLSEVSCTIDSSYDEIKEIFLNAQVEAIPVFYENEELFGFVNKVDFDKVSPLEFQLTELVNHLQLYDSYHVLEALREFMKSGEEHLPVVDDSGFYLGMCHLKDVQHHVQQTMGLVEAGSMLVIQSTIQNYSLVDVAKIVESNQAKLLSIFVSTHPDSNQIEITMTLNVSEINDIVATFNRFNYQVNYSSSSTVHSKFLKERFDSFMHFLEI